MGEIKNGKPDGRGIELKPYGGKYSVSGRMGKNMVKEQRLLQMGTHMKVNGSMGNNSLKFCMSNKISEMINLD